VYDSAVFEIKKEIPAKTLATIRSTENRFLFMQNLPFDFAED
jgi:hypothetical protein